MIFLDGTRMNEAFVCKRNNNNIEWRQIGKHSNPKPCPRASQSCVVYEGNAYIFGGQDDDNNKLFDLWKLNLSTETY